MISGASAMVRCLEQEGVTTIFGYPGATIAPFYDALYGSGIRHVLTRTEQGAGHAASGYARISGRPGVCVATSGPGVTNLLTAIATAYSDSIPMVAISGQVATYQLGHDVFQEVDATGSSAPFTKYSYLVKDAQELGRIFKEAFYIASAGRKGPVLIDVPVDVQKQMVEFKYPEQVRIRSYKPNYNGHPIQIQKIADAISGAKRPLICCGGGVQLSGAEQLVHRFVDKTSIPVVATMMGISALSPDHPLYYGMLGQSGMRAANVAVKESDLLILVGARVGDRAILQPDHLEDRATIIHIDIDSAEIGKNMGTTIPVVGDVANVLGQLCEKEIGGEWSEWVKRLGEVRKEEIDACMDCGQDKINPNGFVRMLCEKLPEQTVYVADVGQNQIWSARNYSAHGGRFLTTGGMGTMGYSIPAAVGAKLAAPERTVVAVCGDGAFQMTMNELATMRQSGAPIKLVLMRNGKLGMVCEIQSRSFKGREMAVDLAGSPDYGKIAAAYGISHILVENGAAAPEAIDKMLESSGAFMLECVVDPEEVSV